MLGRGRALWGIGRGVSGGSGAWTQRTQAVAALGSAPSSRAATTQKKLDNFWDSKTQCLDRQQALADFLGTQPSQGKSVRAFSVSSLLRMDAHLNFTASLFLQTQHLPDAPSQWAPVPAAVVAKPTLSSVTVTV